MGIFNSELQTAFERLKQKRDELKVQAELGKLEAEDKWDDLQSDWSKLEAKMRQLRTAGEDSVDDVVTDVQVLLSDLREGFDSLRKTA